jgi:hypothetical protein
MHDYAVSPVSNSQRFKNIRIQIKIVAAGGEEKNQIVPSSYDFNSRLASIEFNQRLILICQVGLCKCAKRTL